MLNLFALLCVGEERLYSVACNVGMRQGGPQSERSTACPHGKRSSGTSAVIAPLGASRRRSLVQTFTAVRLRRHVEIDDEGGRATEFPFSRGCSFYEVRAGLAPAMACIPSAAEARLRL